MTSKTKQITFLLGIALGIALSTVAMAERVRERLSDQEVLKLGETPGSGEFYRVVQDAGLDNADATNRISNGGPGTFYTSIAASEFRPRTSKANFVVPNHAALRCLETSNNSQAEAQIQFPQGATLQFLRIYASDTSDQDLSVSLLERCQPTQAAGNVTTTVLGTVLTVGTPGRLTQSIGFAGSPSVDNSTCSYSLRVQLASTANGCPIGLFLDKARVQWIP